MFSSWFTRKPSFVDEPDEVYMTRATADANLVRAVSESRRPVIVAAFFPVSLGRIEGQLATAGLVGARWSSSRPFRGGPGQLLLLDAAEVSNNYGFDAWVRDAGCAFSFLFVEHYPLHRTEQMLLDVLDEVSKQTPQHVRFFVGLDEPLMRAFSGDRVVKLMQQLAMPPEEAIRHAWVDKSIVKAQKKLEKRIPHPVAAPSAEEWFERNRT